MARDANAMIAEYNHIWCYEVKEKNWQSLEIKSRTTGSSANVLIAELCTPGNQPPSQFSICISVAVCIYMYSAGWIMPVYNCVITMEGSPMTLFVCKPCNSGCCIQMISEYADQSKALPSYNCRKSS